MTTLKIRDEYIKLGQALKLAGIAQTGADARQMIVNGDVLVNGETELRRGKKLRDQDVVSVNDRTFVISSDLSCI